VIIAEGGRSWPPAEGQHPCGNAPTDTCGIDDVRAWTQRLKAEIKAGSSHIGQLSTGGQWIAVLAPDLAAEITAWQARARDWTDAEYWESAPGVAQLMGSFNGYLGVIEAIVGQIAEGMELNQRARVMIWEASLTPAEEPDVEPDPPIGPPAPLECPEGYTAVFVRQSDGTVVQLCQGRGDAPVTPEDADQGKGHEEGGGGGGLVLLGLGLAGLAWYVYANRGSISGRVLASLRK
jgi:hypothetical protein